ncbi:MAG: RNA polymerase factor sigma-54 [Lachnospiraceae bacterium]|nr:RNA polymerase factor sigma-54 [Lachnospiraceae bacterium]
MNDNSKVRERGEMELNNGLQIAQKQTLSVNQVQSLNILAYTNQELEDFLMNEYLENPMLENTMNKENEMMTDMEKIYERGTSYKDQYLDNPEEEEQKRSDVKARPENQMKDYLLSQLNQGDYSSGQWEMMEYLVECLDEKGYFTYDIRELARDSGYEEAKLRECLTILKELEPIGIFSANLAECLKKQLEAKGLEEEPLFCLLDRYLPELMNGQIGTISRKLGVSTVKIKEYIHLIGSLNPRPVMDIQTEETSYVVPDILVTRPGGQWEVALNDHWMGEYKFNDYYMRMMEESQDPELQNYFKERLERARFVVNCVEQRRKTIVRIAEAVLKLQEDYFEGSGELKPMQMEDVANALGIHVSTVSRAVKGKYIQYKKSVLLKSLFTAAVSDCSQSEGVSPQQIKARIRQLIEEEGKRPLSDQKLAEKLEAEGIQVSRRAVAKYRIQMNIPDSRQRGLLIP